MSSWVDRQRYLLSGKTLCGRRRKCCSIPSFASGLWECGKLGRVCRAFQGLRETVENHDAEIRARKTPRVVFHRLPHARHFHSPPARIPDPEGSPAARRRLRRARIASSFGSRTGLCPIFGPRPSHHAAAGASSRRCAFSCSRSISMFR